MHKAEKNIDLAEKYLLGELDEETVFEFETDVFTDDDLLEHLEVVRQELAEKYIEGQLTSDQRQRFETHFLASPYNHKVYFSTWAVLNAVAELRNRYRL
jgi:anti-sigma-K factor RskA